MLKCKVNTNQHEKLIKKWFQLKVMCHIDLEGSGISISRCRRLCLLGRPQRSMLAINWPSLPRLLDSCSSCSSLAPQKQPVPGLTKCRNHYSKRVAANVVVCLWRVPEKWPYKYLTKAEVSGSIEQFWLALGAAEPWLCSFVGGCNF